jgi:hypothetical protein
VYAAQAVVAHDTRYRYRQKWLVEAHAMRSAQDVQRPNTLLVLLPALLALDLLTFGYLATLGPPCSGQAAELRLGASQRAVDPENRRRAAGIRSMTM